MAGKILIVDDVATNRIVLKVKLASAYYETLQAATGAEALRLARDARPDLILLDMELPDMSGLDVCRTLRADPLTRDTPIIMISAFLDPARRLEGLRAGAQEVYWKPIDELVLLARIRGLLRACETQSQLGLRDGTYRDLGFAEPAAGFTGPGLIGLIAAQMETALHWKRVLQPYLHDQILVMDRDAALSEMAEGEVPDVFLIAGDLGRPGDGLRFMSELRSRQSTRHSSICLVVAPSARETAATALDLGAAALVEQGAPPEEIALRLQMLIQTKQQDDRLRSTLADGLRMAMLDPLTGLHNRRYALPHLTRIADWSRKQGRDFAVLLIDLDRFKSVNDTWGHAAGDAVLVEVAHRLKDTVRAGDLVARIGGEEFLVVLPDVGFDSAHATAERLRRAMSDRLVYLPGGGALSVTLSIGLAMGGPGDRGDSAEALVDQADQALLAAKADGRNQVTVHQLSAA